MVECISFHPERKYTQEQLEEILPIEEEAVTEVKKGTEKGLNIVQHGCDFIKYCKEHAAELLHDIQQRNQKILCGAFRNTWRA